MLTLAAGGEPRIERYWQPQVPGLDGSPSSLDLGLAEAAAEVRRLLEQAVRRRLIADVPLGAFLSGGIDSSAIVAMMAAVMSEPVQTFTIGFDDREGFDERPYARAVARRFGTEHHEDVVMPGRGRPDRAAGLAPRPAVRGLECDPYVPAEPGTRAARHRGALGRRRRRAVRRLRAVRRRRPWSPPAACPRAASRGTRALARHAAGRAARPGGEALKRFGHTPRMGCPGLSRLGQLLRTRRAPAAAASRADDWAREDYRRFWGSHRPAPHRWTGCSTSTSGPTCSTTCWSRPTG